MHINIQVSKTNDRTLSIYCRESVNCSAVYYYSTDKTNDTPVVVTDDAHLPAFLESSLKKLTMYIDLAHIQD